MEDRIGPDLSHPDAIIRLVSTVLRFRCPDIGEEGQKLSFTRSFRTVGTHPRTQPVIKQADSARNYLIRSLTTTGKAVPHKTIATAAQRYIPLIHQILLTCKFQPENARLDEQLLFEWSSGVEKNKTPFKSAALMFDLVMTIATEGLACAGTGCDDCTDGDFASASRGFKRAAGIMHFLAFDQLPKWIAKGSSIADKALPAEATMGTCEALSILFSAIAQQMAVATVLIKPGTPNYSLLAKLTLGIAEHFELFVSTMRDKAELQRERMDPEFFKLMDFQIALQRGLSQYFMARYYWDRKDSFGLAIAFMSEAIVMLKKRESVTSSKGIPEISPKSPLSAVNNDVATMRQHLHVVLKAWEKDNSSVYFDRVPPTIPEDKRLPSGIMMIKAEEYKLEDVEPVPLVLPSSGSTPGVNMSQEETDREMARMLQERLNAGERF